MADIKWIKIVTDIFDNRKIKQIESLPEGDTIIVIWFKLLCLAGVINDNGNVYITNEIPYTDETLATQFNRPLKTIQLAMHTFQSFGMIEIIDDILHISNWENYQNIEGMEKVREQNRLRKQRQRENEKLLLGESHVTSRDSHATDKNRIDIDKNNIKENIKRKVFTPPTLEEIKSYISEKGLKVDAKQFYDYFEEGKWIDSKGNKVKNWKQKLLTWNKFNQGTKKEKQEYDTIGIGEDLGKLYEN